MGLFSFLEVDYPSHLAREDARTNTVRYVQFRTGHDVDGKVIDDLGKLLNSKVTVPNRRHLFGAVSEAMTNTRHHAYNGISTIGVPRHWWLLAMYDVKDGQISVLIYDQGEGIPKTLPRKFGDYVKSIFPGMADDADLIEAAHDLHRTATRKGHRGHGMGRDVRDYADQIGAGSTYRVISGHGSYTYALDGSGIASHVKRNFPVRLEGTLIEWRAT